MHALSVVACILGAVVGVEAAIPVSKGMKTFGVSIKEDRLQKGVEQLVFEHTLAPGATHGTMTQAWHAGKTSGMTPGLRIRMYIDGEAIASIDYPLFLAHGQGPAQLAGTNAANPKEQGGPGRNYTAPTSPWGNSLFGRTHDSGWYNNYLVPFGKSIKITLTDDVADSPFWYSCRGVENLPLVVAGLQLPASARLSLQRTTATVAPGTLITFANVTGSAGVLRQFNLVINSTNYGYQEGCVSALIDGDTPLWLSSGLEDYFLGAYFHSMPTEHLPFSGFENIEPATAMPAHGDHGFPDKMLHTNSLSAYRIHEPDPVLFAESFQFRWIASSDNGGKNGGFCNYQWPAAPMPDAPRPIHPAPAPGLAVSVDALAWVYVWPEEDAA